MNTGLSRSLAALAAAALLLGGALSYAGSNEDPDPAGKLRAGIKAVVADPARAAKMLASVGELEALAGQLDGLIAEERTSLGRLLRDAGSSRAAVDAVLADYNAKRESLARRVFTVHAAFKAEATDSEWKKLRKLELEMITFAATKTLGQAAPAGKEN